MKTLLVNQTSTETTKVIKVTKSSIKKDAKAKMIESINRTENLVSLYFELGLQNDLREQLKHIKTNGIENLIDCFEVEDQTKLVSFLRKVYDLPFFVGVSLKGITPQKFIDILVDLCTVKNEATKKLKCTIVGEKSYFCTRPSEYEISVSFDTKVIEMIFQAYI